MSFTAARVKKDVRRACQACRDRKARFRYRGEVRSDRDHTLCFECFRAARDRQRAQRLAQIPAAAPLRAGGDPAVACAAPGSIRAPEANAFARVPARSLTDRQTAHRRAMLAHLQAKQAGADR